MATYRAVVKHVRYWRGTIHRWSNSFEFTGSGTTPNTAACTTLANAVSELCYAQSTSVQGGIYEVAFYNATGGVPIVTETFFDYSIPGDWLRYSATGWGGAGSGAIAPEAEVALLVEWAGGLSSTGKPVYFRKWFHAVPQSTATNGAVDIASGVVTTLQTAAEALATCLAPTYGLALGNAGRLAGTSPVASAYYSNHQMPKGRRRKSLTVDGVKYKIGAAPFVEPQPLEE